MRSSYIYRNEYSFESQPKTIQARIQSISTDGGLVRYNVVDELGNRFNGVSIVQQSGNTAGFTHTPFQIGQDVILLTTSNNDTPYILGSIYKPPSFPIPVETDATRIQSTTDNDTVIQSDYFLGNGGNFINLSGQNGTTISANDVMRLQLKNNANLRISANGSDNNDNPLNGQEFIDSLFAYLAVLEAKVTAGGAAIAALQAVLATVQTPPISQIGAQINTASGASAAAATLAAAPLTTTAAATKTDCEVAKNTKIILPQD